MKISSIVLLLLVSTPAYAVYADSSPPKAIGEPEVLLTDSAIAATPPEVPKEKKTTKRVSKARKVYFQDSMKNSINMSREEHEIMQARNKMDGYAFSKRKSNERH